MVLGDVCTRACKFCATATGKPLPIDAGEPEKVARSIALMGLKHAVITSVTRDDLDDGGAAHWARVIEAVRAVGSVRAGNGSHGPEHSHPSGTCGAGYGSGRQDPGGAGYGSGRPDSGYASGLCAGVGGATESCAGSRDVAGRGGGSEICAEPEAGPGRGVIPGAGDAGRVDAGASSGSCVGAGNNTNATISDGLYDKDTSCVGRGDNPHTTICDGAICDGFHGAGLASDSGSGSGSGREDDPRTTIEVLIPDFGGRAELLDIVLAARPDIVGHNIETVERLTPQVRSRADYRTSLGVLRYIAAAGHVAKSGIMVGLGETADEVLQAMDDLRAAGVSVVTVGQYLRPTRRHIAVAEYVTPEKFEFYRQEALARGFSHVASGPLVRSSYMAEQALGRRGYE